MNDRFSVTCVKNKNSPGYFFPSKFCKRGKSYLWTKARRECFPKGKPRTVSLSRQGTCPLSPALRALGQAHRPPGTVVLEVSKGPSVFSGRVSPPLWNFLGSWRLGRGLTLSSVRHLKFKLDPSAKSEKTALPFSSQPKRWALAPVVVPTHLLICPPSWAPWPAAPALGTLHRETVAFWSVWSPKLHSCFFSTPSDPKLSRLKDLGLIQTEKRGKMQAKDFRGGYVLIIYF